MRVQNLFSDLPTNAVDEVFDELIACRDFKLLRIVSNGQATPEGQWYDQDEHEWVMLLRGSAALLFEGDLEPVELQPGDVVDIPPHKKHRVAWTDPAQPTVWVALHYSADPPDG